MGRRIGLPGLGSLASRGTRRGTFKFHSAAAAANAGPDSDAAGSGQPGPLRFGVAIAKPEGNAESDRSM